MKIPVYQVDAFTAEVFGGNPAAVCPLEAWIDDRLLQNIAKENNLSETAFFVKNSDGQESVGKEPGYHLRWFTPKMEVDLCGHATLAAAFVLFEHLEPFERSMDRIEFDTKSGRLTVIKEAARIAMFFPSRPAVECPAPRDLIEGLGVEPREVLRSRDYLAVYGDEEEIAGLKPKMNALERVDSLGVIATAQGRDVDFVSRFFAPGAGIPEDPVTGSSHCTLTPFWSERLNRKSLRARQLSDRGGELFCEDLGQNVKISGEAVLFMEGHIII